MTCSETIKIVHPAAENVAERVTPHAKLASVEGARIVLVDSRRQPSYLLMRSLERLLKEAGAKEVKTRRKVAASTGMPENVIQELVSEADAVIYGVVD